MILWSGGSLLHPECLCWASCSSSCSLLPLVKEFVSATIKAGVRMISTWGNAISEEAIQECDGRWISGSRTAG